MNFTWCGQSCGSTSRAFVHEKIYDAVLERAQASIKRYKPAIRPIRRLPWAQSSAVVRSHHGLHRGRQAGRRAAGLLAARAGRSKTAKGLFIEPTIFADVTMDMRIGREEIFGPVLPCSNGATRTRCWRRSTKSNTAHLLDLDQ
jgi:betaine-aldehyde dehydrogenase